MAESRYRLRRHYRDPEGRLQVTEQRITGKPAALALAQEFSELKDTTLVAVYNVSRGTPVKKLKGPAFGKKSR